jgi:hypothetical protein
MEFGPSRVVNLLLDPSFVEERRPATAKLGNLRSLMKTLRTCLENQADRSSSY